MRSRIKYDLTAGFPLLGYSFLCTADSLSLFYLLFIYELYVLGDASISKESFVRTKKRCLD